MVTILILIGQWIAVLALLFVFIMLLIWMVSSIKSKVPLIPIPNSILPDIYRVMELKENSIVYDLGCGDGRVLFYASRKNPKADYIGVENSLFPILVSRTIRWWHKRRHGIDVKIIRKDFFDQDLTSATHIFMYLYPNIMDDILPKLDQELKAGTRLISVSFKFTQKQPIAEFDLGRSKYKLARKIYLYEF